MSLALVSPRPLDELQRLARRLFRDVPSRVPGAAVAALAPPPPPPSPPEPLAADNTGAGADAGGPMGGAARGRRVVRVPKMDLRSVQILWAVPSQRGLYELAPARYLTHLLGHEGPGSPLALLKVCLWVSVWVRVCACA